MTAATGRRKAIETALEQNKVDSAWDEDLHGLPSSFSRPTPGRAMVLRHLPINSEGQMVIAESESETAGL